MNYFKSYNSLSKKIEKLPFQDVFKIYVCGITVYDEPHIGHLRGLIFYDFMRRIFEYNDSRVIFVRNITDIDDKIYQRCSNKDIKTFTEKYIEINNQISQMLNVITEDYTPKVSSHISSITEYIENIIEKGNAYILDDGIYLDTSKIDYGCFEKKEQMISRVQHNPFKKSICDFSLWKFHSKDGFDYKRGHGKPGWHIECSAMSQKILGDCFHIHGGGCDLIFPHHENEIAQSLAFCGKLPCKLWIHHQMINIKKEKMSKSLNNFIGAKQLVYDSLSGDKVRYYILSHHYRKIINFSMEDFNNSTKNFHNIRQFYFKYKDKYLNYKLPIKGNMEYLIDDFNSSEAIINLNKSMKDKDFFLFFSLNKVLGFKHENFCTLNSETIEEQIKIRNKAKESGDYAQADKIRQYLHDNFVQMKDTPKGTQWNIF